VARVNHARTLQEWTERDLSAAARAGELPPAFEVEEHLRRIADVLAAGRRPVLSGESGVGKSAIVHELVRQTEAGKGPPLFAGRCVIQISLRGRAASLTKPEEQIRPAMQQLVDALVASSATVVPFFRDLHVAYELDLEPQLEVLAIRMQAPILGEADALFFDKMLEATPGLDRHYVSLAVPEPGLEKMEAILARWAAEQAAQGRVFLPTALHEATQLTHRFLARSRMPRKVIDFLSTVGSVSGKGPVGAIDVLERFHEAFKVPRFLVDPAVPFDIDATERSFRSRVLGQGEAVRTVVRMISLIKSGLSDTRRPFGAFLFVGPTGVGKTHVAQLLAEYLFGSRDRMIRLNMTDYANPGDAYALFGNPDGYNARQRRGLLTQRLAGHPFGVLLLDEFEKAHEKVHDRFLQLFDEGAFINGEGETISCLSLIVIATSNAGAEVYRARPLGFAGAPDVDAMDRDLDRTLFRHFRFELLNRFDEVVRFRPLSRGDIRTIALREIEALRERSGLKARGLGIEVDEGILDWLTAHGYDPHFGARFLRRTIERNLTMALAEAIVREPTAANASIVLRVRAGRIVASLADAGEPSAQALLVPQGTRTRVVTLDRKGLLDEARALIEAAAPHRAALEERREEASRLVASMSAPGFWDEPADAQRVLERYRRLDVAIQAEARLVEPVVRLAELVSAPANRPPKVEWIAKAVEQAGAALADWEERLAEEGSGAVWLVLRNADPLAPSPEWLAELAGMHQTWCRHLGLASEIVAAGFSEDVLARVVLEVEGPGAHSYLAMEKGIHRLRRERGDLRVRVDVIARGAATPSPRALLVRRREQAAGVEITYSGHVEDPATGLNVDLGGPDREVLDALLEDLVRAAADLGEPAEPARLYAQGGTGARDPRTGALVPRYKDAMRGGLDALLEAWRRMHRARRAAGAGAPAAGAVLPSES
jgi:ATP-dependent Clp protease ATP-binding subunit ClpC